jgi:hypothetical protein
MGVGLRAEHEHSKELIDLGGANPTYGYGYGISL